VAGDRLVVRVPLARTAQVEQPEPFEFGVKKTG
jgi:hypothetical protein